MHFFDFGFFRDSDFDAEMTEKEKMLEEHSLAMKQYIHIFDKKNNP